MKYLSEFRNGPQAQALAAEIRRLVTRPWAIMEVCGGQTHSILRQGLDQLLPPEIELIHGPGCPVCVTPIGIIDQALAIAARPEVTFCTFGDMLRVPGSRGDLAQVKAGGGDVRIVYSPLDALKLAQLHPQRQVVFLAIGFETTAPANAMVAKQASDIGVKNFSLLVSHVLVPPAMEALLSSSDNRVQAFLAAGHVCSVMGYHQYHRLAEEFQVPIVVTGFEPLDLLDGIRRAVCQLESGRCEVENGYPRVVTEAGNEAAQAMIHEVFQVSDCQWRGLGPIPASGWRLRDRYAHLDACLRFEQVPAEQQESALCRSGDVLRGVLKPDQCPAFGNTCTPQNPLGATMVSSEGACAAYFTYLRRRPLPDHV